MATPNQKNSALSALSVVNPPPGNASVTLGGVASYRAVHCAPMARSIAPLKCPAQMPRPNA